MKEKDPSCFYEEKQPHHLHMFNRKSSERNFFEFEGGQYTNLIRGLFEIFNFANFCRQREWRPNTLIFSMKRNNYTINICLIGNLLKKHSIRYKIWPPVWSLSATGNSDIHSIWCHVPVSIFFGNLLPLWR